MLKIRDWLNGFVDFIVSYFKPSIPSGYVKDERVYLLSVKQKFGRYGYGFYPIRQPIVVENHKNLNADTINAVLGGEPHHSPVTLLGSRDMLMGEVKGLTHDQFLKARSFNHYARESTKNYIRQMVADIPNPVTVFNTWLLTQVANQSLNTIDGFRLTERSREFSVIFQEQQNQDTVFCPVSLFLDKYHQNYVVARQLMGMDYYSHKEPLARELIYQYTLLSMGLSDHRKLLDIFGNHSAIIRDHELSEERKKLGQVIDTTTP